MQSLLAMQRRFANVGPSFGALALALSGCGSAAPESTPSVEIALDESFRSPAYDETFENDTAGLDTMAAVAGGACNAPAVAVKHGRTDSHGNCCEADANGKTTYCAPCAIVSCNEGWAKVVANPPPPTTIVVRPPMPPIDKVFEK